MNNTRNRQIRVPAKTHPSARFGVRSVVRMVSDQERLVRMRQRLAITIVANVIARTSGSGSPREKAEI